MCTTQAFARVGCFAVRVLAWSRAARTVRTAHETSGRVACHVIGPTETTAAVGGVAILVHAVSGRLAQATTNSIGIIIGVETYTVCGVPRAAGWDVPKMKDSVLTHATTR